MWMSKDHTRVQHGLKMTAFLSDRRHDALMVEVENKSEYLLIASPWWDKVDVLAEALNQDVARIIVTNAMTRNEKWMLSDARHRYCQLLHKGHYGTYPHTKLELGAVTEEVDDDGYPIFQSYPEECAACGISYYRYRRWEPKTARNSWRG